MTDREVDCEIAKQVFGYSVGVKDDGIYQPFYFLETADFGALPSYTTNLELAFKVIERVQAERKSKISIETYDGEIWSIKPCGASGKNLARVICEAALNHYNHQRNSGSESSK